MATLRKPAGMLLVALIFTMGITAAVPLAKPPPAHAGIGIPGVGNACDLIPDATARKICKAAADPVGSITSAVGIPSPSQIAGDAISAGANAIVQPILTQITQAEGDAVVSTLKQLNTFTNKATTPDTNVTWFKRQYALLFGLGSAFALIFLMLRVGSSKIDPTETGKGGIAILTYIVLMGMMPVAVAGLLHMTDDVFAPQWMDYFANHGDTTLSNVEANMTHSLSLIGSVGAIFIPLVILFFGLVASAVFALMLAIRYEVIFIIAGLLPVAAAFKVGGRLGGQTLERAAYGLLGWILMKPAIAIVLTFGLAIMTQGGGTEPITLGAVILILSIVIPWKLTQTIANHNIRPPHEAIRSSAAYQAASAKVVSAATSLVK